MGSVATVACKIRDKSEQYCHSLKQSDDYALTALALDAKGSLYSAAELGDHSNAPSQF
jgi:hypothetical protein